MNRDILAVSGLLEDVLKVAKHDWQVAATASVSICFEGSACTRIQTHREREGELDKNRSKKKDRVGSFLKDKGEGREKK